MQRNNNWGLVEAQLRQLLQNPAIYQEQVKTVKEVSLAEIIAIRKEPTEEEKFLADDYPKHYPEILVSQLKKARKLVVEKGYKSNQLYQRIPTPQPILVSEIMALSEEINFIYEAKHNFDAHGDLPRDWVILDVQTQEEIKDLDHKLKLCRSRISKRKAIMLNPSEWGKKDITQRRIIESKQKKDKELREDIENRLKDLRG